MRLPARAPQGGRVRCPQGQIHIQHPSLSWLPLGFQTLQDPRFLPLGPRGSNCSRSSLPSRVSPFIGLFIFRALGLVLTAAWVVLRTDRPLPFPTVLGSGCCWGASLLPPTPAASLGELALFQQSAPHPESDPCVAVLTLKIHPSSPRASCACTREAHPSPHLSLSSSQPVLSTPGGCGYPRLLFCLAGTWRSGSASRTSPKASPSACLYVARDFPPGRRSGRQSCPQAHGTSTLRASPPHRVPGGALGMALCQPRASSQGLCGANAQSGGFYWG